MIERKGEDWCPVAALSSARASCAYGAATSPDVNIMDLVNAYLEVLYRDTGTYIMLPRQIEARLPSVWRE